MPQQMDSARAQALSITVGLFTFVCIGITACIALVVVLFYFLVSFVLLVLQSLAEAFSSIAAIWISADPILKVILLVGVACAAYRLYRFRAARKAARP